jgi:hypothetical protein
MHSNGENILDGGLIFRIDHKVFGEIRSVNLMENGEVIPVTNTNFEKYIELSVEYELNRSVAAIFEASRRGFLEIIQKNGWVNVFEDDELDLLISGALVIDWESLRKGSECQDGYSQDSQVLLWFWEVFGEFEEKEKRSFLRFAIGADSVQVDGLEGIRLPIQRSGDTVSLPVAHTCFKYSPFQITQPENY